VVHQVRAPFTQRPTVYIYDNYPGGVGFSDKLYELHGELFKTATDMIGQCGCSSGCPSCVGPQVEMGYAAKNYCRQFLEEALKHEAYRQA